MITECLYISFCPLPTYFLLLPSPWACSSSVILFTHPLPFSLTHTFALVHTHGHKHSKNLYAFLLTKWKIKRGFGDFGGVSLNILRHNVEFHHDTLLLIRGCYSFKKSYYGKIFLTMKYSFFKSYFEIVFFFFCKVFWQTFLICSCVKVFFFFNLLYLGVVEG